MKWIIKSKTTGRYVQHERDTLVNMVGRRPLASVFEGTRDFADGVCVGLKIGLEEEFEPESLVHIRQPSDEHY